MPPSTTYGRSRPPLARGGSAAGAEKIAQKLPGFVLGANAVDNGAMMTRRLGEKARTMLHGAAFRIGRRINEPVDARETDRSGTHGAGFEGHIQLGAHEPLIVVELRSGP